MTCLLHTNQLNPVANTTPDLNLNVPETDEIKKLYKEKNQFVCYRPSDLFRKIMGKGEQQENPLYLIDSAAEIPTLFDSFFQKMSDPKFAATVFEGKPDYAFYLADEKNLANVKKWL